MTVTVKVKTKWTGELATAKERRGAIKGLEHGMEHLLTESRKVVPIEEATLERSGVASVDKSKLEGAVSYDGPYAVRQHEELGYRHDPGRTAKYLENPLNSEIGVIRELIAAELRRALT